MIDVSSAGNMCSTADRGFEFGSSATEVENCTKRNACNATSMNNGATSWQETTRQWVGNKSDKRRQRAPEDPIISWSTPYEDLLWTGNVFDKPIPLSEMVDFLVEIWQDEGIYD